MDVNFPDKGLREKTRLHATRLLNS